MFTLDVMISNWRICLTEPKIKATSTIVECQWLAYPVFASYNAYNFLRFPIYSRVLFVPDETKDEISINIKVGLMCLLQMIKYYEETGLPIDSYLRVNRGLTSLIIRQLNKKDIPSINFRQEMISIAKGQ